MGAGKSCNVCHFYPRSPCGERLGVVGQDCVDALFLSTLSLRRATLPHDHPHGRGHISIHALLAESDHSGQMPSWPNFDFYPRSPCGERLVTLTNPAAEALISIHALLAESDIKGKPACAGYLHFYPRSPCGERPPPSIAAAA